MDHTLFKVLSATAIIFLSASCNKRSEALSVNVAVFEVVDASTGEKLNIGISVDAPLVNGIAGANFVETPPKGPYRVSWLGTESNPGTVRISAEGYEPTNVPDGIVHRSSTNTALGGTLLPETVKLKRK